MGQDHYMELLERVAVVENNQRHADEQRDKMLKEIRAGGGTTGSIAFSQISSSASHIVPYFSIARIV